MFGKLFPYAGVLTLLLHSTCFWANISQFAGEVDFNRNFCGEHVVKSVLVGDVEE